MSTEGQVDHLPCGCVMEAFGKTLIYTPCDLNCHYYKYAMEQNQAKGNKLEVIVDPEADPVVAAEAIRRLFGKTR
jgi:hypothetical protein